MSRGAIDIRDCDREPIHLPGLIQPFGCLVALSPDRVVAHVSENAASFLGRGPDELLGLPLAQAFPPPLGEAVAGGLERLTAPDAVERVFGAGAEDVPMRLDLALHVSHQRLVVEAERHAPDDAMLGEDIRRMIDRAKRIDSLGELTARAAEDIRRLTGFDRVMVYRFAEDGSGEVVAEARHDDAEPFLGLRYPASDIPRQARALYRRNLLRIISDVDADAVPIRAAAGEAEPLDMSLSTLRAVSPVHLEYLRNMQVAASMSISILRDDRLWGLIACHHGVPRVLSYGNRTAAELYGQLFGFLLERVERRAEQARAERARILRDRLEGELVGRETIAGALSAIDEPLAQVIDFGGIATAVDGLLELRGETPPAAALDELLPLLAAAHRGEVTGIECLAELRPKAAEHADTAAGALIVPLSRRPDDMLLMFRPAVARTVRWGGDPQKAVKPGNGRLGPRASFAAWRQVVEGRAEPWSAAEIRAAEEFRPGLAALVSRQDGAAGRQKADGQRDLLIAELNHRVRNILALIRSVVAGTGSEADSVAQFTDLLGGRLNALARAHEQITREPDAPIRFAEMLAVELAAYLGGDTDRVRLRGETLAVAPGGFTALSLVLHELMTNAVKYGALSDSRGRIEIEVARTPSGDAEIRWREEGGPPVRTPTRRGFGSTILERTVPHDLGGEAELDFAPDGLRARFLLPAVYVGRAEGPTDGVAEPPADDDEAEGLDGAALVVEDNAIIAAETEMMLTRLGAGPIVLAARVADALDRLERVRPDFALLDVDLGGETSEAVAERLVALGVPFAFTTGYTGGAGLSARFPDAPVVQKPFDRPRLLRVFGGLRRG